MNYSARLALTGGGAAQRMNGINSSEQAVAVEVNVDADGYGEVRVDREHEFPVKEPARGHLVGLIDHPE